MAFIYEINGQRVEFETEPTEADIDEAAREMGTTPVAGSPNMAPQAASVAGRVAAMAPEAAGAVRAGVQAVANMPAQQVARGVMDAGAMLAGHPPYASMIKAATDTAAGVPVKDVISNATNMVRSGAGAIGGAARGLGSALATGAMAPESAFLMPYQMAAYEQDKIRANPNAPGLESNPYAQVQRGEYATTRAAGAANQRSAVRNMPYGNVTARERDMLEKDRLNMQMRMQAAKRVLGQQQ